MSAYLRAKFQVSTITLTSFRQGGVILPFKIGKIGSIFPILYYNLNNGKKITALHLMNAI